MCAGGGNHPPFGCPTPVVCFSPGAPAACAFPAECPLHFCYPSLPPPPWLQLLPAKPLVLQDPANIMQALRDGELTTSLHPCAEIMLTDFTPCNMRARKSIDYEYVYLHGRVCKEDVAEQGRGLPACRFMGICFGNVGSESVLLLGCVIW